MDKLEFETRYRKMLQLAHGRWTTILRQLGVNERILNKRNQPCPLPGCGGRDRFQYTDKFGEGNYHCRYCGAGGGFKLLRGTMGWSAVETLERVEQCIGMLPNGIRHDPSRPNAKALDMAHRIWSEARPIQVSDQAHRYLLARRLQLDTYPATLRFHAALGYYERTCDDRCVHVRDYPALLARIDSPTDALVALHRIYLENGSKASVAAPKKTLCANFEGGAIRLAPATEVLNVCEGLENALAVFKRSSGEPVWSAISASNMQSLWIPPGVRFLRIYADNDADSDFAGQVAAFTLARAARKRKIDVKVFVPHRAGSDWADVWYARSAHLVRVV
ncbi:toprim domain-containing protein [Massilia sp. YMA4]|uniref:Toprim domain-containing protein n=1 Tax=[Empedobacter] haloabium TaxID=592317 RepID=A0ABZ1URS5_9BURK|nr:toprim domain-containing protein [Massilia sp. YMA4]AXA91318.1 zinc-binding protein [Massilia sp. YMA4]